MEEKVIKKSYLKIILSILILICFCFWFADGLKNPENHIGPLIRSVHIVLITSVFGVIGCPFLILLLVMTLFNSKFYFKINKYGIHNYSTDLYKNKFILWKDIKHISYNKNKNKMICLYLKDTEKYIDKNRLYVKIYDKLGMLNYKEPVRISYLLFDIKEKDFKNMIKEYDEKYRKKKKHK